MNFQIPQNLDVEDSVIFGLTFTQLLFLGGGIGITFFLFTLTNTIIAIIIGIPAMLLGALLAFFKYNNQSFIVLFQALIRFFTNKRIYKWEKVNKKGVPKISIVDDEGQDVFSGKDFGGDKIVELSVGLNFEEEKIDPLEKELINTP